MSTAIASVVAVIGEAHVRNAKGELRAIKPGDVIFEGDIIVTSANGRVELKSVEGRGLEIEPNQTVTITAELTEATRPQAQEASLGDASIDQVLATLEQGGDLNAVLEETAGGLDGGGNSNDGNNFVRLLRIQEGVDPLSFNFASTEAATINPFDGGTSEPINQLPLAAPDFNSLAEDTPLNVPASLGLLVNDSDPEGGALTVTGFSIFGVPGNFAAGSTANIPGIGDLTINPDGSYSFTPAPNYNGPVPEITYTVQDPAGGSTSSTLTLTVGAVVDLSAADDAASGNEDTPISGTVAGNDSTTSGGILSFVKASDPANGSVVMNPDGSYTYTPNPNFNGSDSFTYTVTDSASGESLTRTVVITVNPVADLSAADDSNNTLENTPVSGSVAGNDSTSSGGNLNFVKASDPANGTVVMNPDGSYTYTPNPDFNGSDTFTYTVSDPASGESLTRTVVISVTPAVVLNAGNDSNTTTEDMPVNGTVAGNDSTTSGGSLSFVKASDPANGSVVMNTDGSYTYTPNPNFNGIDTFTYTVTDAATGESLTRTVNLTVDPVVDLSAADDSNTTVEDTPVDGTVAGNDSTTSGGNLNFVRASDPANGTVSMNPDGTYTYSPNANFTGTDSFTYSVTDPVSGESLTRTVTITVDPAVDLSASNDSNSTDEDTPVNGTVAINDSTTSGGLLSFTKASDPANGSVVMNPDGSYTYTPNPNFIGSDSFTYTVTDAASGESLTRTVFIAVNPVVDLTAADDNNSTNEDTPVTGTVAGNDSTTSGGSLSFVKASDPANGSVMMNPDGSYTYTPNLNFNGIDSFTYTVTDSASGESQTQTVVITVNPVSDLSAADDSGTTLEDTPLVSSVAGNDSTSSGGNLSFAKASDPVHGIVVMLGDGSYTYTPDTDFNGSDSFTYTVTDSVTGETLTRSVAIEVTPAPDIAPDSAVTGVNGSVVIDVNANDDFEDAGHRISAINGVAIVVNGSVAVTNGTVTLLPDGRLEFSPNPGYVGSASFSYRVEAGGVSETASVSVNVIGIDIKDDSLNDDMLSSIDNLAASVLQGQIPPGGTLTGLVVSNGASSISIDPSGISINPDGSFSATFDASGLPDGILTVTMTAQDSLGHSASTQDSIAKDTVTPVSIDPLSLTNGGTPAPITGSGEPGASIVIKADGVILGNATVNAGGTWTFTPTAPLGDGVGQISAEATDLFGNTATSVRDVPTLNISDDNAGAPGHATVDEAALSSGSNPVLSTESAAGSFTLAVGSDELARISVAGVDIAAADLGVTPITINTLYGQISINGYTPASGVVNYSYTLLAGQAHPAGGELIDAISLRVTDNNGDSRNDTLNINIVDDVPSPQSAALASLAEGGITITQATPGAGNLLANDTLGADGARVYDFTYRNALGVETSASVSSGGSTTVTAQFGTLTVSSNGDWQFTSNSAINHVSDGANENADFSYRLIDGDGDISTIGAVQPIRVSDTQPAIGLPDTDVVREASLATGSSPNAAALTQTGTLAVSPGADVFDTRFAAAQPELQALGLTRGGVALSYSVSADGHSLTAKAGTLSVFTVAITNPGTAAAGYSFTLVRPFDHPISGGTQDLPFAFGVRDADGDSSGSQFVVSVVDDARGLNQAVTLNEDATISVNTSADATGSNTVITSAPSHGTASIANNGKLNYTPAANYSGSDTLTYTTTESGVTTTTTVSITVNPRSDTPILSRDAASAVTLEDTPVALGLNAPTVRDATDQNGAGAGDNPERLSLISLTGIPAGVQLLDGSGTPLFTSTGGTIRILLSDAGNLRANPGNSTLTMTTAQFEALMVNPIAHRHINFTVTMSVTEYEVNDGGAPIGGVNGATASTTVLVNVHATTDAVDLKINGSDVSHDVTINEDSQINLGPLLSVSFLDLDGSERRYIDLAGLPEGSVVNGVTVGASGTASVQLTGNNTLPNILLTPPHDFSGDINGITVTLRAQDSDSDSPTAAPAVLTDTVNLNLHVNPVGGDFTVPGVATPEDTPVRFLQNLVITDNFAGSEVITGISVKGVPSGWIIKDAGGAVLFTGNGIATFDVPAGDVSSLAYQQYSVTPLGHSSLDANLTLSVTSTDTNDQVNGATVVSTVSRDLSLKVTVNAVAESIGGDSDGNAAADLTMNGSFIYITPGQEDTWFALNQNGFSFAAPWHNEDADEQTFALLTPRLSGGSAIGSQFEYTDASGVHVLTYVGTPVQIPVASLDSVRFKAAANVAGAFEIDVQARTVDTDPDTGASVSTTSGSATLTNLEIAPVADAVTLAVDGHATGNEDSAIALIIRPTSSDPSETFDVTLSGIPSGVVIRYNSTVLSVVGGSVTISHFDASKSLTLTPPQHSNVDFTLNVSAVSVDSVTGIGTSISAAAQLPISVDLRGVADPASITTANPTEAEVVLDASGDQIALNALIIAAGLTDLDGSEGLTLKITGLDPQFDLSGATHLYGNGVNRVWALTPAELASAKIDVPMNYSGTLNLILIPVTTENDGHSLSGTPISLSAQVTPSPEATLNHGLTLNEDTLTRLDFTLQTQNGDSDEFLNAVWIKAADVDANPNFSLYLGNSSATPLASGQPGVTLEGGWYKLNSAAFENLFVKGADNRAGNFSFGIQYEVADPAADASMATTYTQNAATYSLSVMPVTDAADNNGSGISSSGSATVSGSTVTATGTSTVTVAFDVSKLNDANAQDTPDIDGSETLMQLVIDGVPQGVSVEGAIYIGNSALGVNTGQWLIDLGDSFNSASLPKSLTFSLDGSAAQLGGLNQTIRINAVTQDGSASKVSASTQWTLVTAATGDFTVAPGSGSPTPPASILDWHFTPITALEDVAISAADVISAQISGSGPFSVTLTNLPAGTQISGMTYTEVNGVPTWTAGGNGGDAALQAMLDGISIQLPANYNQNHPGGVQINATLTTYTAGGLRNDATLEIAQPVTPVTDPAVVTINAPDVGEDSAVVFTVRVENPADGSFANIVDGKLYLKLDASAMHPAGGGVLSDAGGALVSSPVSGIAGIPDGDYYVIDGVAVGDTLSLTYTSAAHASGPVALTAFVQSQEDGAANIVASSGTDNFIVRAENTGFDLSAANVSGVEDAKIMLNVSGSGLIDADGSESVVAVVLKHVPNGFLVYYGADEASAVLATNSGSDGSGNNIWAIPAVSGLPAYIAVLPPPYWSGSVTGLEFTVLTQDAGLSPRESSSSFDLSVASVANVIELRPTLSFGGEGNLIPLNLNASMVDADGSETVNLTLQGLGEYAAFFANGSPLTASYDSGSDTYTLNGIGSGDINNLAFIQADSSGTLNITASTSDGSNTSTTVSASMAFTINDVPATTGANTLLYDGNPLNGLAGVDVVQFRLGEDIDFAAGPVPLSNIETLDLMPAGQDHSVSNLSLADVLNLTDGNHILSILGDAGDSVSLKNGVVAEDAWSKTSSINDGGHNFDVYTNALDPSVTVRIEQAINANIV
jgi:VCBS repeat-containing protein